MQLTFQNPEKFTQNKTWSKITKKQIDIYIDYMTLKQWKTYFNIYIFVLLYKTKQFSYIQIFLPFTLDS